jgi:hypothetical protein
LNPQISQIQNHIPAQIFFIKSVNALHPLR